MSILVKQVRVKGFRGLHNIEVNLSAITIITGLNNAGKTSFLKALQLVFGNRKFLSQEDFSICEGETTDEVIIDSLIIPIDDSGKQTESFNDDWEILFTEDRIKLVDEKDVIPLRTVIKFDSSRKSFKTKQYILSDWPDFFSEPDNHWYEFECNDEKVFRFDEIPFFYMDAQRDILEDIHLKSSYLGKMISKIEYSPKDIGEIEKLIKELNESVVGKSDILCKIKTTLKDLDSAMDSGEEGIEITPFTKKLRDLNKGLSIYYNDSQEAFSMEYHGMGTRSWSSLLTLKSFISLLQESSNEDVFFPLLAIEEPEAHLHPNAQKRLYSQLKGISGQKIISTHSPYIAGSADLAEIRSFYKKGSTVISGQLPINNFNKEDLRKIERMVMNTRGEIIFSKVLILFEGETEEQALPIFANKHFNKSPLELGIDFIGVGGCQSYLPFLRLAEALNIPWFILSDADNSTPQSVRSQFDNSGTSRNYTETVFFVDSDNDFERQLVDDGFQEEIKQAILSFDIYSNEQHRSAKEVIRNTEVNNFDDEKLYIQMTAAKTKFGPVVAEKIVRSDKPLPPKVTELFENIAKVLSSSTHHGGENS
jgi:putative ATP-dependent endonuclease of the OLD family